MYYITLYYKFLKMVERGGLEPPMLTLWVAALQAVAVTMLGYLSAGVGEFESPSSILTVSRTTNYATPHLHF